MAGNATHMRIGPTSLMTLVAVLLLAVLTVLCVTSANASAAMAQRQAGAVQGTYALDACGQRFEAALDAQMHANPAQTAEQAAQTVAANLDTLQAQATDDAGSQGLALSANVDGSLVRFTVSDADGKTLDAAIRLEGNGAYSVDHWKTSTEQTEPETTLWQGAGA